MDRPFSTHGSNKCILTYLLTYLLTPWFKTLFENLIVNQPDKKYFFYGTQRFITVFTKARHWTLSWASWIQVTINAGIVLFRKFQFRDRICDGTVEGMLILNCKEFLLWTRWWTYWLKEKCRLSGKYSLFVVRTESNTQISGSYSYHCPAQLICCCGTSRFIAMTTKSLPACFCRVPSSPVISPEWSCKHFQSKRCHHFLFTMRATCPTH
jgi:hypothetical protein